MKTNLKSMIYAALEADNKNINADDIYAFTQVWDNTCGGFGGIGGDAMTSSLTIVMIDTTTNTGYVFFDGKLAYKVDADEIFMHDVINRCVAGLAVACSKYKMPKIR